MSDIDFDFDECAGIANRPIKDLDGFVKGKLTSITIRTETFKTPRSKKNPEDDRVQKVFVFTFIMEGKTEPIKMTKMTGTKISTEIVHVNAKGRGSKEKPEYNALTEICLKLGILTLKDVKEENTKILLDSLKKAVKTVSEDKPIYIKTKLENSDNALENILIRSIELIEKF